MGPRWFPSPRSSLTLFPEGGLPSVCTGLGWALALFGVRVNLALDVDISLPPASFLQPLLAALSYLLFWVNLRIFLSSGRDVPMGI